ncbi:MAG: hypothetical protein H7Z12_13170 [Rhodospirillaceae bacterium]|nr:hypothetical protein [Rhodospirillales bacterium]
MMRNWLGQFAALAALLGFVFAATNPAPPLTFDHLLGTYVCHAPGEPRAALPGEDVPKSDGCCLVCQVAQLAGGAVLPQHAALSARNAVHVRAPVRARLAVQGEAAHHAQARAPPSA